MSVTNLTVDSSPVITKNTRSNYGDNCAPLTVQRACIRGNSLPLHPSTIPVRITWAVYPSTCLPLPGNISSRCRPVCDVLCCSTLPVVINVVLYFRISCLPFICVTVPNSTPHFEYFMWSRGLAELILMVPVLYECIMCIGTYTFIQC